MVLVLSLAAAVNSFIKPHLFSNLGTQHLRTKLRRSLSSIHEVGGNNDGEGDENYDYVKQFDEFSIGNTEEEKALLEQWRTEKVTSNDRWQSCLLRDNHGGEWTGSYEMYVPTKGLNGLILKRADGGIVCTSLTASDFSMQGVKMYCKESYDSDPNKNTNNDESNGNNNNLISLAQSLLLNPTRNEYDTVDFRAKAGNQVVANAFTLSRVEGGKSFTVESKSKFEDGLVTYSILEVYVAEVAIKKTTSERECDSPSQTEVENTICFWSASTSSGSV